MKHSKLWLVLAILAFVLASLFTAITVFYQPVGAVQYPREFASAEELRSWVNENRTPLTLYPNANGVISFVNIRPDPRFDCDDYVHRADTVQLLDKAQAQGLILWACPVFDGMVWNRRVSLTYGLHIGCWTQIGSSYYYVEASPLDPDKEEHWRIVYIGEKD